MNWKVLQNYPDEVIERQWNDFLAAADFPTHYTSPAFFTDPFAGMSGRFAVLAFEGDRIDAVLTGTTSGSAIDSGLAVRPQTAFRPGSDRRRSAEALLKGIFEIGGDRLEQVRFHSWTEIDGMDELGFRRDIADQQNEIIMLDLAKGKDAIFKDFSQTRRNELRRAIKLGLLEVKEIETRGEMLELYEIHKAWNRRKGHEPNSIESFEAAIEQRQNRKVLVAVAGGQVVAGSYFRFCSGGVVEYAANNSLEEFQLLRPNDLICWRAIEWACEAGFRHFSMGGSHLFLRRFGGESVATFKYTLDRTFLKRHEKREQLARFAHRSYQALPAAIRNRIRAAGLRP